MKIETKRLVIRKFRKNDYKKWREAFASLRPKKNRWDWGPYSEEKLARENYDTLLESWNDLASKDQFYRLGVFEKESGKLVGMTMLMDISRGIFQNAYLGYHLFNNFWGHGYGTEMVTATIKLAFSKLKLHRVEAGIDPHNIRSIRLAKKARLRKEGRSKRRLLLSGKWHDMMIYALTAEELSKTK